MPILIVCLDFSLLDEHSMPLGLYVICSQGEGLLISIREKMNGEYENSDHV